MSKTPRVMALGAAAALLGGLTTAHAAPAFIYTGTPGSEFEMKFSGRTTETSPLPAVGSGLETTWGVGYVNEFQNKNNPSEKFWQSSVAAFGNATITYMLYGIADARISGTSPNINIYNVGCTVGPNCDGKIHIDFYIDEAGPGGTNPSFTDPANGASARVGTTVNHWTDDTFLMSWELVPGVVPSDDPGTVFDERDTVLLQTVTSESLPATASACSSRTASRARDAPSSASSRRRGTISAIPWSPICSGGSTCRPRLLLSRPSGGSATRSIRCAA
jgi:hypothetical protein